MTKTINTDQQLIDQVIAYVWSGIGPLSDVTVEQEIFFDHFSDVYKTDTVEEPQLTKEQCSYLAEVLRQAATKLEQNS